MAKSGSGFGWGSSTQLSRPTQLYRYYAAATQISMSHTVMYAYPGPSSVPWPAYPGYGFESDYKTTRDRQCRNIKADMIQDMACMQLTWTSYTKTQDKAKIAKTRRPYMMM